MGGVAEIALQSGNLVFNMERQGGMRMSGRDGERTAGGGMRRGWKGWKRLERWEGMGRMGNEREKRKVNDRGGDRGWNRWGGESN